MSPEPLEVGNRKQLFIDDRFVDSAFGIERRVQPPEKGPLVLRPSREEGTHQFHICSVVEFDGLCYLYYATFATEAPPEVPKGTRHLIRLALSSDGLHWERVRARVIDVGQGMDNNIVMAGGLGVVFIDPNRTKGCPFWWAGHLNENPWWAESKGTVYTPGPNKEGAVYLCCSEDGVHWHRVPEPILPFWCDTRNQVFYDCRLKRYVAYLRGRPDGHLQRAVCRAESRRLLGAWPFTENPRRQRGPTGCYGWIEGELPVVLRAGDEDPPQTGLYTPNVHLYPWAESAYFAFPETYRCRDGQEAFGRDGRGKPGNEGPVEVALAVSRDGVGWQRFPEPYVRLGRLGEIDAGTVYMGVGMIRKGAEIRQYSAVSPHPHHGRHLTLPGTDGGVRVLRQRLDGFVFVEGAVSGGELVSPPLLFSGTRLQLNADCGALGEVWVELQHVNGRPVPGYSLAESVSVDLNGAAQEVWWRGGPDVSPLQGMPVRLRVRLRRARLYAFQFVDRAGPQDASTDVSAPADAAYCGHPS